ncbi:MAG TPA: Eco57I restriction-modification methylase domain-containing protein [Nitrososphaera sp.]|nr:Eco57I restriction-modification methylase domain-containing protein [Nitrososphaera sp.]
MNVQTQLTDLPITPSVRAAVESLANAGIEERGAIYTRQEVVDFILDLIGYTPDKPLHRLSLLEPSFGKGDFLVPVIKRLLESYRKHSTSPQDVTDLLSAIRAIELHLPTFTATRKRLEEILKNHDFNPLEVQTLLDQWLLQGDFLLIPIKHSFDYIIGNPPYVRQELIPDALIAEYRNRFKTIYDRADLYIPFIERSLILLNPGGTLGFICSDRWMKNRYGGPLRRLVAESFHLKFYVDMVDTPAFHSEVIAYPAITVIQNEKPGPTRLAHRPEINRDILSRLARELLSEKPSANGVKELHGVARGREPWILESWDQLSVVRRLEKDFPTLEDAGCKVGIGVATGADKVFIAPFDALDVEPDRKLPLVMTRDILTGSVAWRGFGVINPFDANGGLVSLAQYPKLAAYLKRHAEEIKKRHVSKRNPENWYRTIDRIYPGLVQRPKLLIPDIKGEANIVYEGGEFYPHHNLYYITSEDWNLKALQAVLKSGIARLFVSIYSTKMHGGFLRFQAQYLRRIRIPRWRDIQPSTRAALTEAAEQSDAVTCNAVVSEMYGLTKAERAAI